MKSGDAVKTPRLTQLINAMTVREASTYLHVCESMIYRLAKGGQIPAFRIRTEWRFDIEAIDRWRSEQEKPRS
jgi:excisionase family DNA binding protein